MSTASAKREKLDGLKRDCANLEWALSLAGGSTNGSSVSCPFHDDHTPSGSIFEGQDDGAWLYKCQVPACGWQGDALDVIRAALDVNFIGACEILEARSFLEAERERLSGTIEGIWHYVAADGATSMYVVRFETNTGKEYRPYRLADGKWALGDPPGLLPLYRLDGLAEASRVYVVEGEKCAEELRALGLTVTTSAHGAASANKTDWSPLCGREVVIVPDNDESGRRYAESVSQILRSLPTSCRVAIVDLPGLPAAGDIVDYIAAQPGKSDETLRNEIESLVVQERFVSGPLDIEHASKEFPDPSPISKLGSEETIEWAWHGYLARKFVTLLTGFWKAGKTTLVTHLLKDMTEGGSLGPDVAAGRALVITEEPSILWARRRDELGLGDHVHLYCRPFLGRPDRATWDRFVRRVEELVLERKYSVVVFDPLLSFSPVEDENNAAQMVTALAPLHRITNAGAAVLLLHHPRKSDGAEGQASRGSGALPGFVDIIMEFRRYRAEEHEDRRRTLVAYSRLDETPKELVLELTETGYIACGDRRAASQEDRFQVIGDTLDQAGKPLTAEQVLSSWPEQGPIPKPGNRALRLDLERGAGTAEGSDESGMLWCRQGKGVKGDPYLYSSIACNVADGLRKRADSRNPFLAGPTSRGTETNSSPDPSLEVPRCDAE